MNQEKVNQTSTETIQTDAIKTAIKEVQSEQQKIEGNTTTVKLPSNGLINPNITEVTLRRMSVKESKTLHSSNDPNYLSTLVVGCIIDPVNVTTSDLTPNDIIYLSFILRYISSPKKVQQVALCTNPACRKEFTHDVNIPELKVNYADPSKYKFEIKLPDKGDLIKFKILSEAEITNCEKIAQRKARQNEIDDVDWYMLISKVAYLITEINNEPKDSVDEKIEYLESLSAYDFEIINKAYNTDITSTFGLDRQFYTECPYCKEDVEVTAYIAPDFFQLV